MKLQPDMAIDQKPERGEKKLLIISGTQRSGTTLMSLIFKSRPDTLVIDEDTFEETRLDKYLQTNKPLIVIKAPHLSHRLEQFCANRHASTSFIWMHRNTPDTIASMLYLMIPIRFNVVKYLYEWIMSGFRGRYLRPDTLPWICHPFGGLSEIRHLLSRLQPSLPTPQMEEIKAWMQSGIMSKMKQENLIKAAVYCIYLKNQMLKHYRHSTSLQIITVQYEHLVSKPESVLPKLVRQLDLDWDERMLQHHLCLPKEIMIGETDTQRAIDQNSLDRFQKDLSGRDLELITEYMHKINAFKA